MALKKLISKAEYNALKEEIKGEYILDGEGYKLDLEGDEDSGALLRAKDHEKRLRREAEENVRKAQAELDKLNESQKELEKTIQAKTAEVEKTYSEKLSQLENHIKNEVLSSTASKMASEISTVPNLMSKAIHERLTVDIENGTPVLKIIGSDGKPSAMKLEELKNEFVANKDYSSIIIANKASGGSASKGLTSGSSVSKPTEQKSLAAMSPRELADHLAAKKANEA